MKFCCAVLTALLLLAGCGQKPQRTEDPTPTEKPRPMPTAQPAEPEPPPVDQPSLIDENPYLLLDDPDSRGPRDLVIVAVGDVSQPTTQWVEATESLKATVFDPTRHLTMSGDLTFMNLENPMTKLRPNAKKTYAFTSDPQRLDWYFGAGFNMYSLANNHIADANQPGIDRTIQNLEEYAKKHGTPVYHAGAGSTPEEGLGPRYFKPDGKDLTVAFFSLGFSKSSNVGKFWDEKLEQRIKDADEKADLVFVSVHAGKEYQHVPEEELQERYRSWVDWGADLVVGHHTHCIQPVEAYGNGLIFYSLGNFVFMSRTVRHRKVGAKLYGMMVRIVVREGRVHGTQIIPTWVNNSDDWTLPTGERMENANFVPQLLTGPFAAAYFEDLARWTEQANATPIEVDGDVGYVTVPAPAVADNAAPQ